MTFRMVYKLSNALSPLLY